MKRYVDHVMGMPISLALRGRHQDDAAAAGAWDHVMASLLGTDEVFSTYRADSVVSRLGRGELDLADCPEEVTEVLLLGDLAARASDGAFSVWRPHLDPSGVVKGWAVDRAAEALRTLADTDFCLSAGGDIVCASRVRPWRVGIEHPLHPDRLIATVSVRRGAVATSGTAHRGEHLVDARTGTAPEGVASVTVVAPTLTVADIDATCAYALGQRAAQWLSGRRGRSGLVVWTDGTSTTVDAAGGPAVAAVR